MCSPSLVHEGEVLQSSRAGPQLPGLMGRRRNELKDLVRYKCSVWELLSRRVDDIARAKSDFFRRDFCDWDIRRYGDCLRAVLIANHKRGAATFFDGSVRHARVRCGRARDCAVGHSAVGRCTWGIRKYA